MNKRNLVLGAALFLTLAATWWASNVEPDDSLVADAPGERVRPTATRTARSAPAQSVGSLASLDQVRADFAPQAPNVFGRPVQIAPPVVRRPPPPPVKPAAMAPPVPYTFIGSLKEEGERTLIFLMRGDELVSVRVGRVFDKTYRVKSVDKNGVDLIYLPLGLTQRIELADRS